jgi:hypothetical protein
VTWGSTGEHQIIQPSVGSIAANAARTMALWVTLNQLAADAQINPQV